MALVLLDADAASLPQKGRLPVDLGRHLNGATLLVPFITVGEFYKWAERRSWGVRTRQKPEAWLHTVVIIPADREVTRTWGTIPARADTSDRPRPANDS